jgi:hypothetical protein
MVYASTPNSGFNGFTSEETPSGHQSGDGRVELSRLSHDGLLAGGNKARGQVRWLRASSYPPMRQ